LPFGAARQHVARDDLRAVEELHELGELIARRQHDDAVEKCLLLERRRELGLDVTLAVRDDVEHDASLLLATKPRDLDDQLAKHLAVVASALRAERQQIRHGHLPRAADLDRLVHARIEEAHPDLVAFERELLDEGEREATCEHLPLATHRGRAVDHDVLEPALVFALLLAAVVEELVVDDLLLEDLAVVGELGEHERIDVALALDGCVTVDGEGLAARRSPGLEHARQQIEREVRDVVRFGRAERGEQIDEIDRAAERFAAGRRVFLEQSEQTNRIEIDELDLRVHVHRLSDEVLDEAPQAARIEVAKVIGVVVLAEHAEVQRKRLGARALAAIAPAVIGVAEDARQQHGDHLVAQPQAREPLGHLRRRDVLEEPAILIELRLDAGRELDASEMRLARPQRVATGTARHRQHHADVVDDEQR